MFQNFSRPRPSPLGDLGLYVESSCPHKYIGANIESDKTVSGWRGHGLDRANRFMAWIRSRGRMINGEKQILVLPKDLEGIWWDHFAFGPIPSLSDGKMNGGGIVPVAALYAPRERPDVDPTYRGTLMVVRALARSASEERQQWLVRMRPTGRVGGEFEVTTWDLVVDTAHGADWQYREKCGQWAAETLDITMFNAEELFQTLTSGNAWNVGVPFTVPVGGEDMDIAMSKAAWLGFRGAQIDGEVRAGDRVMDAKGGGTFILSRTVSGGQITTLLTLRIRQTPPAYERTQWLVRVRGRAKGKDVQVTIWPAPMMSVGDRL